MRKSKTAIILTMEEKHKLGSIISRSMVVQWRQRFAEARIEGLEDAPRCGRKPKYDKNTERRILALLDTDPPTGYASWSGKLVSQTLKDVPPQQVWRVLRKHGIHLQRGHSWCVSTDPEFTQKAAAQWSGRAGI